MAENDPAAQGADAQDRRAISAMTGGLFLGLAGNMLNSMIDDAAEVLKLGRPSLSAPGLTLAARVALFLFSLGLGVGMVASAWPGATARTMAVALVVALSFAALVVLGYALFIR